MIYLEHKNIIGKNIKRLRTIKNLTQEELSSRVSVQGLKMERDMISKAELQIRPILDYEIKAIARALEVKITDLFED